MSAVCPVCGKGESEDFPEPTQRMWLQRLPISHLACVKHLEACRWAANEAAEKAEATLRESPFMVTEWKQRAEQVEADMAALKDENEALRDEIGRWRRGLLLNRWEAQI